MEMPKPSPGHLRLKMLAGDWEGEETMHPSRWDPQGGIAVGRTNSRMTLGGLALVSDYEQEREGAITYRGHGIYTFDPKKKMYSLYWVDSMGSPPETFTGGFDGDILTLSHTGPRMHVRLTCDLTASGSMVSKMEMSEDGVTWNRLFDARYSRR